MLGLAAPVLGSPGAVGGGTADGVGAGADGVGVGVGAGAAQVGSSGSAGTLTAFQAASTLSNTVQVPGKSRKAAVRVLERASRYFQVGVFFSSPS